MGRLGNGVSWGVVFVIVGLIWGIPVRSIMAVEKSSSSWFYRSGGNKPVYNYPKGSDVPAPQATDAEASPSITAPTPVVPDCQPVAKAAPPRFELIYNGTAVIDHATGLAWEVAASGLNNTPLNAMTECLGLTTGGHMGWRLPQAHELMSLDDPTVGCDPKTGLRLPAGSPFKAPAYLNMATLVTQFWTSTAVPATLQAPDTALRVDLCSMSVVPAVKSAQQSDGDQLVWCVYDYYK